MNLMVIDGAVMFDVPLEAVYHTYRILRGAVILLYEQEPIEYIECIGYIHVVIWINILGLWENAVHLSMKLLL